MAWFEFPPAEIILGLGSPIQIKGFGPYRAFFLGHGESKNVAWILFKQSFVKLIFKNLGQEFQSYSWVPNNIHSGLRLTFEGFHETWYIFLSIVDVFYKQI